MSIVNKVTIISGATGGLGQVVSQMFHQAGAIVVLLGTRPEGVQALADGLGSERILPLAANLSDPAGAEAVIQAAVEKFGRADILLNLAGGFGGGQPLHESDPDILPKMLDLNLYTTYNLCRAAIKPMIAQGWGRIVNIGSRDSLKGRANFSAYAISKAGVLRLTESLAAEVEAYDITVNAILPGTIDTDANRKSMPQADPSKWVKPATIGETILFLVQENTAINGASIPLYKQA